MRRSQLMKVLNFQSTSASISSLLRQVMISELLSVLFRHILKHQRTWLFLDITDSVPTELVRILQEVILNLVLLSQTRSLRSRLSSSTRSVLRSFRVSRADALSLRMPDLFLHRSWLRLSRIQAQMQMIM